MTISLKSDASGNSGSIQVAGVDRLTLNLDGSLMASANPATGARSKALATMQKFADEFGASLVGNGYQKLPSGLIIQWGFAGPVPGPGSLLVTFPIAFASSCFGIYMTPLGSPANQIGVSSLTKTQFEADYIVATDTNSFYWFAVGF